MGVNELKKQIELDNTLKILLDNPKRKELLERGLYKELWTCGEPWLDLLGHCHGEDCSLYAYIEEFAESYTETYVILRDIGNGRYEFVREVEYMDLQTIPIDMSKQAMELRNYIEADDTLDIIPDAVYLKCLGCCVKYFRRWLFQYINIYVLLDDFGNGHYGFYKEVQDPNDAPVDERNMQQSAENIPSQDNAGVGEDTDSKKNVTYFVAECMEIYGIGEYHDKLTVDKAVELYCKIPPDRKNAIKGIGITIHIKGQPEYTDSHYDLMRLGEMDSEVFEYAGEDEPLVRTAFQALSACLKKKSTDSCEW